MLTRRRALGRLAWPLAALAGCAGQERQWRPAARGELLTPLPAITGGRAPGAAKTTSSAGGERLRLERPVAVAARGDVLVIADAGARTLWRYDRKRDTLESLAPFTAGPDDVVSMQLDSAMRVWVALPAERAVDQFDTQGRLLRRWRSDAEMPLPVAVLWSEEEADVLVGDGATFQIVALDKRGSVQRLPMPELPLRSLVGLAPGPRSLYVLDRLAQRVVTVGPKGEPGEPIGHGYLVLPRALAADGKGRVYVADELDQRIYVFRGPKLIGRAKGTFGRIESMALDGDRLYVADSLLGRVHALQVVPASREEELMR
jgi:hypothetical protein